MDNKEVPCKDHPDAPHGFMRDASHSAGRYVCECEFWKPQGVKIHAGPYGEAWIAQDGPLLTDTKPLEQKPVAHITGFHNGYCVIQPTDPAVVLPVGTALYRASQPIQHRRTDMNKQDILKLAADCGIICWTRHRWANKNFVPIDDGMEGDSACLLQFAELIAKREREACAKLFDGEVWAYDYREIAAAIRARGEQ